MLAKRPPSIAPTRGTQLTTLLISLSFNAHCGDTVCIGTCTLCDGQGGCQTTGHHYFGQSVACLLKVFRTRANSREMRVVAKKSRSIGQRAQAVLVDCPATVTQAGFFARCRHETHPRLIHHEGLGTHASNQALTLTGLIRFLVFACVIRISCGMAATWMNPGEEKKHRDNKKTHQTIVVTCWLSSPRTCFYRECLSSRGKVDFRLAAWFFLLRRGSRSVIFLLL